MPLAIANSCSYLGNTLAVLAAVENGPGDAAGVLALEEQRLRLAILEAEDLAITTDVDFTLITNTPSASSPQESIVPLLSVEKVVLSNTSSFGVAVFVGREG
jgi:hypothetical protein